MSEFPLIDFKSYNIEMRCFMCNRVLAYTTYRDGYKGYYHKTPLLCESCKHQQKEKAL